MTDQDVMAKVVEILRPLAKDADALTKVNAATDILSDLRVNSARLVDAILAFEDEFDIEIADEDIDSVATVGDAVTLISTKLAA
ncbi:MAG: phosphopantetheine-binding protein [Deltaproteobacteria bacterium]